MIGIWLAVAIAGAVLALACVGYLLLRVEGFVQGYGHAGGPPWERGR